MKCAGGQRNIEVLGHLHQQGSPVGNTGVTESRRTGHLGGDQVGMRINKRRPRAMKDGVVQAGRTSIEVIDEQNSLRIGLLDRLVQFAGNLAQPLATKSYPFLSHRVQYLTALGE